jgi:hypothetical protein
LNATFKYALLAMMIYVEHKFKPGYPSFVWGKDISVKVDPDELEVSAVVPLLQEDRDAAPDALRAYRLAVRRFEGPNRQGKNSPHIEFANADNDQELIKFVQRFGPVVVSALRTEERESLPEGPFDIPISQTVLVARQSLAELRSEHVAYRSALLLVSELHRGRHPNIDTLGRCVEEIVETVSAWPRQWDRERQLRASQSYVPEPQWFFRQDNLEHLDVWKYYATRERSRKPVPENYGDVVGEALVTSPTRASHNVICELVNAFNPLVYLWGDAPVEAPHWDLTGGIRPILYYILRREYIQAGGIGICRNTECRDLFEIERFGQEFCGDLCSRLQRQREYWQNRGKKMRKRRPKKEATGKKR